MLVSCAIILVFVGIVFYYCYKTRQNPNEYFSIVNASVVEIQHVKGSLDDSYFVTLKYDNITQTFNNKELFYRSMPGRVIPMMLYRKYNRKNKLVCQRLEHFKGAEVPNENSY